jgi:hypothetical protein
MGTNWGGKGADRIMAGQNHEAETGEEAKTWRHKNEIAERRRMQRNAEGHLKHG